MAIGAWVRIGLVRATGDPFAHWANETLAYSGLPYQEITDWSSLASYDVIVLFGNGRLSPTENLAVRKWADLGGRLIATGGTWGLEDVFGVKDLGHARYSKSKVLKPVYNDRLWPDGCQSIVFFGGCKVAPSSARTVSRTICGDPAIARNGRCILIAPHLGQTLATMLLGRSVETDGIGPGDDTVCLEDGVRRAEDGTVLDYATDRSIPGGASIPIFGYPYADLLREVFYRALFESVEATGKRAYALWRWPSNASTVSTVSIDCDVPDIDRLMDVRRSLEGYGQRATWLVQAPGLPADVCRRITNWNDSIGLLFDLNEPDKAQDSIKRQAMQVTRSAGVSSLNVVRPSKGEWRGLKAPYALADAIGAGLCTAKGGFQAGSSGFTFGSCCVFRPEFPGGQVSAAFELPFAVCRPGFVTETRACQHIIDQVVQVGGCLHTALALSVPAEQETGLVEVLRRTKEARFGRFSPEDLLLYERARRAVTVDSLMGDLKFTSGHEVKSLTLMVFGGGHEAVTCNRRYPSVSVRRHGTLVSAFVINLEAKTPALIRFEKTMVA